MLEAILAATGGILLGLAGLITAIATFRKQTTKVKEEAQVVDATADVIEKLVNGQSAIVEMLVQENKRLVQRVTDQNMEIKRLREQLGHTV